MLIRAGVVGRPIGHSLSPALHRAAYRALGLSDHRYDRFDVGPGELAGFVAGLQGRWCGLSVTMPGKEDARALAARLSPDAELTGAVNTLLPGAEGWSGENTDVFGVREALRSVLRAEEPSALSGASVRLIGSGATARSALVAVHRLGVERVSVMVRDQVRPQTAEVAARLGMRLEPVRLGGDGNEIGGGQPTDPLDVVINTVPAAATAVDVPDGVGPGSVVFDVNYAPWPTRFAAEARRRGAQIVGGGEMLIQQAMAQVELMTGLLAPADAMRTALAEHLPTDG